jgi:hypothetical protein
MTADQFVWWIRGYLAGAVGTFDPATVRDAVDRVGPVHTPPAPTPPSLLGALGHCLKCGKSLNGLGSPHYCAHP